MVNESSEMEIMAKLNEIFCDVFDDDNIKLTSKTSAADIPDWDSLTSIVLCAAIGKAFDTKLSAVEAAGLTNVGELVARLRKDGATKTDA